MVGYSWVFSGDSVNFEIDLTYDIEEGIEVELTVSGVITPAVLANCYGHPDAWTPGEGPVVEVQGVANKQGCPLPGVVVARLLREQRFLDTVERALESV